ncbi:MAG: ABC transporter permease, partial [Deltaproteobacteria bacterium]|nr:ABC transporter permease [Deltaproteobacteria bacterium]
DEKRRVDAIARPRASWGSGRARTGLGAVQIEITMRIIVNEHQAGTLQRLQLTSMTGNDLFGGVALSQMVLACIQVPVMFGVAVALGYDAAGSIIAAIPVGLALSLSAVGLGLLVACVARNPTEAANLGAGVLLPVTFLSGAFFPVPDLAFLSVAGRDLGPWHIFPARHALAALRQQLTFGAPMGSVVFELVATVVLGLGMLWIGAAVFQRTRMRPEQ